MSWSNGRQQTFVDRIARSVGTETVQAEHDRLMATAREIQIAQRNNIRLRLDAQAFGQNERELERIWARVDALRAKGARPRPAGPTGDGLCRQAIGPHLRAYCTEPAGHTGDHRADWKR